MIKNLNKIVLQSWQRPNGLSMALWPLSQAYRGVMAVRRRLYENKVLSSYRAPIPVIVVGNITVGGTGKTPLVIHLVEQLRTHGYTPGVISRGYSGVAGSYPLYVTPQTPAIESGDEPALIVRRTAVTMAVDANREAAIDCVLQHDSEVNVIVSDDGLQHLALQRDIELCLVDDTNAGTNNYCLPAGPFREPLSRLNHVDFVIHHRANNGANASASDLVMRLVASEPKPLRPNEQPFDASKGFHAVAGIGNPKRFFDTCKAQGWSFTEHAFDDHHIFSATDFDFSDDLPILMTEKDAVKCHDFADSRLWYLPVDAKLDGDLLTRLLAKLKSIS